MKTGVRWGLGGLAVSFIAIQAVPVERTNPPVEADLAAPTPVKTILRRSCYDCHSNETRWPWYAHVAPVSWLVVHDVNDARDKVNFSSWELMSPKDEANARHETWKEIENGKMPLPKYVPLHPEARLSPEDVAVLREWFHSAP
jgi:hypothetical protein